MQSVPLLSAKEAAARLGMSRRHLLTLVASGELPVVRFGARCVRYNPADLDALIERRTGRPRKATGGRK